MGTRKSNKSGKLIYVITGKEQALVNTRCKELVDTLLEPSQKGMGLFNVDPGRTAASEVFDELRTLPFLTEKRVVLIKGADDFVKENRPLLEKYFENPSDTGILILTVSSWSASTKLAKKLSGVGELISITEPKCWELPARLAEYTRDAHDKNLTKPAAELLIELSGENLAQLYSEVDKLALFALDEKTIKPGHIEALTGHNRLFNCFSVIDAVTAGNLGGAISRLRKMFAEDKSAEYTAVGAFAFHFRRMFGAKVLLDKGVNSGEVARRMRIWGQKEGFFAQVRRMSLKQIGSNLEQLASIDYAIKTGQTKAMVAIEQLIFNLVSRSGGRVGR